MGNIISFPKKPKNQEAQVLRLRSFIQSNIIQLADLRKKLQELEKEVRRLKRAQLQIVQNADSKADTD